MWKFSDFDTKVKAINSGINIGTRFKSSSLTGLYKLLDGKDLNPPPASWVIKEIESIPSAKRTKYYAALEYLIYNYPNMVPPFAPEEAVVQASNFDDNYDSARGDLIYGIHPGRCDAKYMHAIKNNYCDELNNHFGIGNGDAFKKISTLNKSTQRQRVTAHVNKQRPKVVNQTPDLFKQIYHDTIMGSSYSPTTVFNLNQEQLIKEKRGNRSLIEMQWAKAIRRACKHGIKMIASQPQFTMRGAKIHFVLDKMGDLGKVAFKEPLNNKEPYVSITSSEVCFCFRNWHKLNLHNIVYFYVNCVRVPAPWSDEWTKLDVSSKPVKSGYDSWRRYDLKRKLLKGSEPVY